MLVVRLGPWRILDLSSRAREVPPDHASFWICEDSVFQFQKIVHHYWLYFENGHSGWVREISEDETHTIGKTLAAVIYAREEAAGPVDKVIPTNGRVRLE